MRTTENELSVEDRTERFAVIGAGPVGLGIARALLAHGIPYDQLEADDEVGGNWHHGVYSTAHIISSRKATEYADYPMPADYPDFPSAQQMLDYLRDYTDHFGLRKHIEFGTKVVMARPATEDGSCWLVELVSTHGEAKQRGQGPFGSQTRSGSASWPDAEKRDYKGLIVCNGHHWDRRFPSYPGTFAEELIHSKDYKSPDQLRGKRVLVIGGGNSACDIAAEAARVGASCDLSVRRGYWFLPKTLFGVPLPDVSSGWFPVWAQRLFLRLALKVIVGDYRKYGLPKPDHRIFETHPTINSELLHYVKHGRIRPRQDVARYDGRRVEFVDGSAAEYDLVVCATGFHVSFPFLPAGLVPVEGSVAKLYAGTVLPDYKNLYIVGTTQVRYGFGPLVTPGAELIARMIEMQERMELPLGLVLRESGYKLPTTHLVDPHSSLRRMRMARYVFPLLERREHRLRAKFKGRQGAARGAEAAPPAANPDVEVY
jgi:Flavin-binding monooxygenase-like